MKTQYYTACSLDRFIATEEHSLDWLFALGDPTEPSYPSFIQDEIIVQVGALNLGSGRPLLRRRILPPELELTALRNLGSGFAELTYAVRR